MKTPQRRTLLENEVVEILARHLKRATLQIRLNTLLREDLNVDSFAMIELAFALEDKYKLQIPEDEMGKLKTVKNVVDWIESKIR